MGGGGPRTAGSAPAGLGNPSPSAGSAFGVTQGAWRPLAAAGGRKVFPGPCPCQSLLSDFYPLPPFAPPLRNVIAAALRLQPGCVCVCVGGPRAPQGTAWGLRGEARFLWGMRGAFGSQGLFIVTWQREGVCGARALGAGAGTARERRGLGEAPRGAPEARGPRRRPTVAGRDRGAETGREAAGGGRGRPG